MPADAHRHALGDPGPDHVPDGRAPQIVEESACHVGDFASGAPCLADIPYGSAVPVEDRTLNSYERVSQSGLALKRFWFADSARYVIDEPGRILGKNFERPWITVPAPLQVSGPTV